jgi:hypothetical protein
MRLNPLSYGLAGLWRSIYFHDSAAISVLPGWPAIILVSVAFAGGMFVVASAVAGVRSSADWV